MVPLKMKGKYLMPLNEIKKIYPEIYKEEIKKYEGRKKILKIKIPQLNCSWNDVIHMGAIPPRKLKAALMKESGFKDMKKNKWFQINPKSLDPKNTIIYLYSKGGYTKTPKDFVNFKAAEVGKYNKIGQRAKNYYKMMYKRGKKPLLFGFIPHFLYKGKIDISQCKVVEW